MKAAILLFALLALACTAHALPVEPNVVSSVDEVHAVDPAHPRVEEADPDVDTSVSEELVRPRRSPRGWQPRGGFQGGRGGGFPQPQPQPQPQPRPEQSRGSVSGGVHRERGVGTVVHAQGQGTVWQSRDGRSSVDAHGHWSKVVRGPARGRPDYSAGVRFQHRF